MCGWKSSQARERLAGTHVAARASHACSPLTALTSAGILLRPGVNLRESCRTPPRYITTPGSKRSRTYLQAARFTPGFSGYMAGVRLAGTHVVARASHACSPLTVLTSAPPATLHADRLPR